MKLEVRTLFTVRHTTKYVYLCISQYSTTHHIITKVKRLLKQRNIKHTNPRLTNRTLNAKRHLIYLQRNIE